MVPYRRLSAALKDPESILMRWGRAFERSPLRMPKPNAVRDIAPLVARMIEGLTQALPSVRPDGTEVPGDLRPGSPGIRGLEQAVAFAGASMAASGVSGFDVAAAVVSLRDVVETLVEPELSSGIRGLFEWLMVVCEDSWGMARERVQTEKLRELIERDTPVVLLAPTITAVTLIGSQDKMALDAIFARMLLLVVRVGASATIVDATGLEHPDRSEVIEAVERFFSHGKVAGKITVIAVGMREEDENAWRALAHRTGVEIEFEAQFYEALQRAHQVAGYRLVRA